MRLRVYEGLIVGVAAAALVVALHQFGVTDWKMVLFLGVLAVVTEWLAVDLAVVGSVSLTFSIIFAAVVLGGPADGVVVAAIGSISLRDIAQDKPLDRMVFNTGQYVLLTFVAGVAQLAMGMTPLLQSSTVEPASLNWLLGGFVIAAVIAGTNMLLVGVAISLYTGMPLRHVWRESFRSYTVSLAVLALLGMVLAQLIHVAGVASTFLLVIPFAVARQTFQVYTQQAAAYRDTVRSLVTVLEAKDPYTRGHSERVAWYARRIAEGIGLGEHEVQRIEWAALLHDIGKVAIPTTTLVKPGALTDAEYDAIKEHPGVAVKILDGIDLLSDVVPLVGAHHERPDANGYPDGLSEGDIPLGAHILAVADCFDAMTSNRSYRSARTYLDAIEELKSVSGKQLDSACVDVLIDSVDESSVSRLVEGAHQHDA